MGRLDAMSGALWVEATSVRYTGKATMSTPMISVACARKSRTGRRSIMGWYQRGEGSCQYCTFFSTKRNCTTVSVTTMTMRMTDCEAEPPMSSALKPS